MHCPGGNATEPIWRVLASSLGISSWTPLKPQHSNPYPNPLAYQLWRIDFLTSPALIITHRLLPWISYATQNLMLGSSKMVEKQSEAFHTYIIYTYVYAATWKYSKNTHLNTPPHAHTLYIYKVFFHPVHPELGTILSGQTKYSNFEYFYIPGWELNVEIQWSILKRSNTSSCFDARCLCREEKIQIILYPDPGNLLNQICDLIAR